MIPCISQAATLATPFEDDLEAFARNGWTAVELWLTKLEAFVAAHSAAEARSRIGDLGLAAPAAAGQGGLLLPQGEERQVRWDDFRRRVELLHGLGVATLVLAADTIPEVQPRDYAAAVESLRAAAELARGAGLRLALEFQSSSGLCASLDTAAALVAQAEAPELGICLDLFHYYTGPSKFEDLAYLSRENLAWVQLCDLSGVPREMATDSDRILPGEGDFQTAPILAHLRRIGYDGGVSVELMNPRLWRVPVDSLADAARRAVLRTLAEPLPPSGA